MATVCSRGLAGGEDNFGEAGAQAAMVVDAGVADVLERQGRKALSGGFGGNGAAFDLGEEFEKGGRGHDASLLCWR